MKENIQIVYIGARMNGNNGITHAYLVGQSTDPVYFKSGLHKRGEIGAVYEATREASGEKGWLYSAKQTPVDHWTDLEQVADWARQDEHAREWLRIHKALKSAETLARKCITPDLRRAWRNSGADGRRKIVVALIESLEKRS